jgi:hypothetical protein
VSYDASDLAFHLSIFCSLQNKQNKLLVSLVTCASEDLIDLGTEQGTVYQSEHDFILHSME